MRQFSVEVRSREEPNAKLSTDFLTSLKVGSDTLVTSGKKSPKIYLICTWREEMIGIAFFTKDDCIRIPKFQTWWTPCDNGTLDVLFARGTKLNTT
jgi:hypothetical protein